MPNLSDYGIDLANVQTDPVGTINEVLKHYESAAKNYRATGETVTTGIKSVIANIKENDPATVNLTDSLMTSIRSLVYETLLNDPAVSVLLFDAMQDLKDGIASFRTEAIRGMDVPETDEPVDLSERFEEVEFLHRALSNFVNFAQMNGLQVKDLPGSLREVSKKSGKSEVKLPRKPNGPDTKESDAVRGKHAAIYKMQYNINGETVPNGVSLNRLALFYCSTPDNWINGSELMDLVKTHTGNEWGAGDWSIKVPVGTLSAIKVKQ